MAINRNHANVSAAQLRVMPLHAVTEVYGTRGLRCRLTVEADRLPDDIRRPVLDAARWANALHTGQRRTREPYVNHVLRVTLRMLCHYRVTDPDVLVAGLLHDTVEDQPWKVCGIREHGPPPRTQALDVIADRYNLQVAGLVAAVTTPARPDGVDRIGHYVTHLKEALEDRPWARVIKLSDFTDNGVGLIHAVGPLVARSAAKYDPAVPVLRDLLDRTDTPLEADVKDHIRRQLNLAQQRFTAILAV
ncbi:HD domain-containing protein [Actinoplanes sp. M2I2]|uniref:HD domain-containing protein n=1 Tax=Actinoplanes sp. M2I2 TaxID=1734444 RepID=UPI00202256E0|nr:HD domain-containing protein [Actinoplanes sp. M2I2]